MEYRLHQDVRLYAWPKHHPNSHAKITKTYPDGSVWLSNMNMPYQGTINRYFTKREFEMVTDPNEWDEADYASLR